MICERMERPQRYSTASLSATYKSPAGFKDDYVKHRRDDALRNHIKSINRQGPTKLQTMERSTMMMCSIAMPWRIGRPENIYSTQPYGRQKKVYCCDSSDISFVLYCQSWSSINSTTGACDKSRTYWIYIWLANCTGEVLGD
jgi:hypothetical protein